MPKKRFRPEDIITKLREADILISQGHSVAETIKQLVVSDVT
jgi:putative transposase